MTTIPSPRDDKQHRWLTLPGHGEQRVCAECHVREGTPAALKQCAPPLLAPRGARSDYDPFNS